MKSCVRCQVRKNSLKRTYARLGRLTAVRWEGYLYDDYLTSTMCKAWLPIARNYTMESENKNLQKETDHVIA